MTLYDCCYSVFTNHTFRKTVFYSLLVVMTLLTIHDILDLCMQYKYDDKKAEMSIVFNETMTFPNMTFCMTKRQAWSHFKINSSASPNEWDEAIQEGLMNHTDKTSFLKRHWDFRLVVEAYQVVATLNSMERETTAPGSARSIYGYRLNPRLTQTRVMINKWLNAIKDRNVTFAEFQQKVGFETLKRSLQRFQRLSYNEDDIFRTKTKITWLSLMQLCFQPEFHEDSFKPIDEQGEYFTLSLSHNAENLQGQYVDCLTLDLHGRPTDLARNMEGKGRIRDGVANELCMSQRHEVLVEVAAQYITLPSEEPPNACKCYEPGDESEFDCKSRCRLDMIKEMCNCTAHTLSYLVDEKELETYPLCTYEKCVINIENFTLTDQDCAKKCLPDCVQTRYNLITTNKGNSSRPDITLITLFWSSFEYLQLQQDFEWTPTTFFAALGGSLGLWLGLSILSFIQLLIFVSAMLSKKVKNKNMSIHPAGMQMTEKGKPSSTASSVAPPLRGTNSESSSSMPVVALHDANNKTIVRPVAEERTRQSFNKFPVS